MPNQPFTIPDVAEICHETNRAFSAALEDRSQTEWQYASESQKRSAVNGVAFCLMNPDQSASVMHETWMKVLIDDGWAFGPNNPEAKTHPDLLPWDELSPEQKTRDRLFKAIVWILDDLTDRKGFDFSETPVMRMEASKPATV